MNTSSNQKPAVCLRVICLALIMTFVGASVQAQVGYVWARGMGGAQYFDFGLDATSGPDGQIYLCGEFEDTCNFGGTTYFSLGSSDTYSAKLDASGSFIWVNQEGSTAIDRNFSAHLGVDGHLYTCGYGKVPYPAARGTELHQYDAINTRVRPDGSIAWGRAMLGDVYSQGHDVVSDAAGNSYLVGELKTDGWYGTDTLHGHGLKDGYIVKFDSLGQYVWGKTFGGSQNDFAYTVGLDAQGNIWVGGSFSGVAHFDSQIIVTTGKSDAYIAKLDPNGAVMFVKAFTGSNDAEVVQLDISSDGDCYFTGAFAGNLTFPATTLNAVDTSDVFYGKLDKTGGFLWARQAGGFDLDVSQDLEIDAEENIYISGFFFGSFDWQGQNHPAGGFDHLFFAKTDSNGILGILETSPDSVSAGAYGIGVDPAQNVILTGSFGGFLDLGSNHLISNQFTTDIFYAKYATRMQQLAIMEVIGTPYCSNDQFQVVFQAWGNFAPGNVFTVELSDASGSFASPQTVGSLVGSFGDTIYASIPQTIVAGTQYRLRLHGSQPVLYSPDNGSDITLNPNTSIPVAILGDTVLCNGQPVSLSVSPAFVQQTWSTGDTSQTVIVTAPGLIWVEATDNNGCTNRDEVLVTTCVGLQPQMEHAYLQLAPNPAHQSTTLSIGEGHAGSYEIAIIDLMGKVCQRRSLNVGNTQASILLDISGLSSGMYLATIQNGQAQTSLRLMVR